MPGPPNESAVTVLWLLPAGAAADYFRETIARLAGRYDAPVFAPHLTLGLGSAKLIDDLRGKPLELVVTSLESSAEFTKTLFVRFQLSPALAQLRASLGMNAADYDPHLSLLYHEMPLGEKRRLAASLQVPFSRVRFTVVQAVRCALPVAISADVAAWATIARKSLHS